MLLAAAGAGCYGCGWAPGSLVGDSVWSDPAPLGGTVAGAVSQPILVPIADSKLVWEATVDAVDDFFRIQREQPVRQVGDLLVEGQIETRPLTGATFFEPQRDDSVGAHERLESTLQSIRRIAFVRVIPSQAGYWVDVRVEKELEDLLRPENATVGPSTLGYDQSLDRPRSSLTEPPLTLGWIPQGRDILLEQEIHRRVQQYLGPLIPH
jgi:hypothetical protein